MKDSETISHVTLNIACTTNKQQEITAAVLEFELERLDFLPYLIF
jgi:hypothetical protein